MKAIAVCKIELKLQFCRTDPFSPFLKRRYITTRLHKCLDIFWRVGILALSFFEKFKVSSNSLLQVELTRGTARHPTHMNHPSFDI